MLTKSGVGSLILSGTNTYTGETTIAAGTLEVQGRLGSGNYTANISNSAILEINSSSDQILSGTISGSGALTKDGSGTLTLSGTNTYSGTTTISAGTLTVSGTLSNSTDVVNSGTYNVNNSDTIQSLSGSGNTVIASSQTLTTGDSGNDEVSGVISGSGAFTKAGSGTQTLSGNNTYTGATTISAGTLTVSGTLSNSTAVSIASGATYDVDQTDTVASIEGAGNIEIASAKTLTAGDSNDKIVSGDISGSGNLLKVGSGTLTLSGNNSKTGSIGIAAGTLSVSSSANLGATPGSADADNIIFNNNGILKTSSSFTLASNKGITMTGAGTISTDASTTLTYGGVITDSGALTKNGAGTLILTGENTYTGGTTVSAGTLTVGTSSNGSDSIIVGNVSVEGGVLSGGGVIDGNVTYASSAGTLAPGNSIGTLTVGGNLTLSTDDTTEIEFNASSADKIIVNGDTTIAGTISLFPENTTYSDTSFTIVDASNGGTFSGTFGTKTINNESNLNGATWDIVYDTNAKTVSLALAEAVDPCNIKCTTTQNNFKDIAEIFDNAVEGTTLKTVADILSSATVESVNTELNKLKGTVLASSLTQSSANHNYFNRAVSSVTAIANTSLVNSYTSSANNLSLATLQDKGLYRNKKNYSEYYDYTDTSIVGFIKNNKNKSIFENFETDDRASFVRTFGTHTKRKDIGIAHTGYDSDTMGILLGEQFKIDEENFNGYSIGLTKTDTEYNKNYGDAEIYSLHASLFKQIDESDRAFSILSSAYISKTDSTRNVEVFGTNVNDKYKSNFYDLGFNLEAQHIAKFNLSGFSVSPSAKINYTYIMKGNTKESGGDLALKIKNEDMFIAKPEIGISIGKNLSTDDNKISQFDLAAYVSRDYFLEGTKNEARFVSGSAFNLDLPRDQEDYYSLGLGYNFLNKETNQSLMANVFLLKNSKDDISSNIFSFTFRKLFGEFSKGRIPPVIATKKKNEEDQQIVKVDLPNKSKTIITEKDINDPIKELEKNLEIVLKENPTKEEVLEVYNRLNNQENNFAKQQLTLNNVYNNLHASCYAIEKNLLMLVNYYNKIQLYSILDKCTKISELEVHLIANRLHEIQLEERNIIDRLYSGYLKILNYISMITFVTFIILIYEFTRRFVVNYYRSKNTI